MNNLALDLDKFDLLEPDTLSSAKRRPVNRNASKSYQYRSYEKAFKVRREIIENADQQGALFEESNEAVMYLSGVCSYRDLQGCIKANQHVCVNTIDLKERATALLIDYLNQPESGMVFCDSGAFRVLGSTSMPVIDFDSVMAFYRNIAEQVNFPSKLTVCAPDVIGNQAESFALQLAYKDALLSLISMGVRVVFPLQKGPRVIGDVFKQLVSVFGEDNIVAGLPSNAEALSMADIELFLSNHPKQVHLLGANKNRDIVKRCSVLSPDTFFTCDANRLLAYVGEGRPLTDLHHDLTEQAVTYYDKIIDNDRHEVYASDANDWFIEKSAYCLDYTEFNVELMLSELNDAQFISLLEHLTPFYIDWPEDVVAFKQRLLDETVRDYFSEEYTEEFADLIYDLIWDFYRNVLLKGELTSEKASPYARAESVYLGCVNHLFDVSVR